MNRNWVSDMERQRFPKDERDKADELFRAIGMDPEIYMPYARAQVVRVNAPSRADDQAECGHANNHPHNDRSQAS